MSIPVMRENLAAVLVGLENVVLQARDEPVPGPGEVVVEVHSVGVCGSDVHYFEHGRIGEFVVEGPLVLGHEASGVVTAVGPGVLAPSVGQRVAIEPGQPDGTCEQCLAGRYNLCPHVRFLATPPIDGAFVRRLVVLAAFAHPVPDALSDDAAALIEPLSVAVAACRKAAVGLGSSVLVTGAGPIGILVSQVALHAGADKVVLVDINPARRERATQLTSAEVVAPEHVPNQGVTDCFIECSGAGAAAALGFGALAPAGRAVMVGMGSTDVTVPTALLQGKELLVTGSFRYANTYPTAIALAASGAVDLDGLVDRHFGLNQVASALTASRTDPSVLKSIVRVQD